MVWRCLVGTYGLHVGLLFARMYIYGLNFGLMCFLKTFMNCILKYFNLCVHTKFFLKFHVMHPAITIGQRMFERLKPFFVRRMKDWNTCCYIYHVKIDELWTTFNNMRKAIHGSDCTYSYQIYGCTTTNHATINPTTTNHVATNHIATNLTTFWINSLRYNMYNNL
jgi:hypothetical protein